MTPTHTPGPWTFESLDNVDFTVLGGKSGQVRVAVESSERDARLIAAAPDLLAALVEVTDRLATFSTSANLNTRLALEAARAAISRATAQ